MKCHNIFTLDENRDEPTFTNDKIEKERQALLNEIRAGNH